MFLYDYVIISRCLRIPFTSARLHIHKLNPVRCVSCRYLAVGVSGPDDPLAGSSESEREREVVDPWTGSLDAAASS